MGRKKKPKIRLGDRKVAIAYIRVSTDEQKLGPQAQRDAIESWAIKQDVSVARWRADEGFSGAAELAERPGLQSAINDVQELGAGLLVVAKRDRLARDALMAALLEKDVLEKGARIVSADGVGNTEGPEGQLLRGMLDNIAQYERAIIRDRIKRALSVKKNRGELIGSVPFGFRLVDGKDLEPDLSEQGAIERILSLRNQGLALRSIAQILEKEGHPCRGRSWHAMTIQRVLKR
jgi:DNA invertase Pin-like site-specific DNA recombinase